ncbi:MAG: tetratricopeptide repeat protein [Herpetosiphonaceae bacterium]|nr:tetratricopeptide repeat protein [Herpetosiphonaceae bacterium]
MTQLSATDIAQIEQLLPRQLAAAVLDQTSYATLLEATAWLHEQIAAVSRFVPAPVLRHHLHLGAPGEIHGSMWHGSLLFADLSGFTALSEHLASLGSKEGAEEITHVINRLFTGLVEQIEIHGGDLIKFGGDALTVFFDAALLGPNHAAWAVAAAQRMQERMAEIGTVPTRKGTFDLRLRIGVHSGQAFAALLGDEHHQELLLTGNDVNHVARAQEIARPGEVVISATTLAELQRCYSVPREDGFEAVLAFSAPTPPGAPVPFIYPPDTNDLVELRHLLRVYAAIRLFLPQNLTEDQLIGSDETAVGEFRLVAVLFAHITPFSAVIEHYQGDPQAITPLINSYYQRMQQIVTHYGGVVNKLDMAADGDKLMAIFGAPIAHENDAELALRAGLAMQETMNEINVILYQADPHLPLLDQQIGINQGHVFAGLVGSDRRREYTVMGDPVNIAARLMSAAAPGDILVSPAIKRINSGSFAFETLPPIALKGKSEPIEPARVDRAYNVRREVTRASLVGRQAELTIICEAAASALRGTGHVIAVTGEAGIGKSRLLEEVLQWLTLASFDPTAAVPTFTPITVECQFYEQTTPYASASELLSQILRLRTDLADGATVAHVTQRVERLTPELARFTPLLSDVLHLPFPESPLTQALTPEQRHDRALDLIEQLIYASARQTPLVLLWDDLHWIDASSRELIERLSSQIANEPLLFLAGLRPESTQPIAWPAQTTAITLSELSDEDRVALASAILGGAPVPEQLASRWMGGDESFFNPQGNPFFIEEMMRGLIEQQVIVQTAQGWVLHGNMDALPTTIEGVITARLDRLEARTRETVQVASVIGRRFNLAVISGLANSQDLAAQMDTLAAADLVLPDQLVTEIAYLFKHTLTRDVAYEGILYARRRELHRRVAARIESIYGEKLDDVLPVLARHYARAEEWAAAVDFYLRAGRLAQSGYFNAEAMAHYSAAIELLSQLPTAPASLSVELHERLGYVQLQAGEYPAALESLAVALELLRASASPQSEEIARLLRHSATVHERRTEYEAAFEQINQALRLLGTTESVERTRSLLLGAGLHQRQGRYQETIIWAQQGLALAKMLGLEAEQARSYLLIGGAYRLLGKNEQAVETFYKSIELYKQVDDIARLADAYNNAALALSDMGKWQDSISLYTSAYDIKLSINDYYGQALVLLNAGDVKRKMHQIDQAIADFQKSLVIWEKLGSKLGTAVTYMNIGCSFFQISNILEAENYLDQSRSIFNDIGAETHLPELYRIYAELFISKQNYTQALDYCDFSVAYAKKLSAKADEGLAELLRGKILMALSHRALAIQATKYALDMLATCDNQQDILASLEQLALFTAEENPTLSKEYADRVEQLSSEIASKGTRMA